MMIPNFGTVLCSRTVASMIEVSQQEPAHLRGTTKKRLQRCILLFRDSLSFFLGAWVSTARTFSCSIGFNAIMGVCAGRVRHVRSKSVFIFLYELAQRKAIYRYIAFRFLNNVLAVIFVTSSSAI
ncbi:hypothetical protein GN244_ATG03341 [Phytophthora infestans]|uniref:Uncharacterized protein n=1 Tax=Phytophthora infestans TaxID=4787 RepID=A0A833SZQ1_PHYIN|nr:hypothetical protein GN244_ATG03341 [Phytophthora infestans]